MLEGIFVTRDSINIVFYLSTFVAASSTFPYVTIVLFILNKLYEDANAFKDLVSEARTHLPFNE